MTGVETSFAAIAADDVRRRPDQVRVVYADTASAPYAGMSGGSKITYTVGRAVEMAAREARERLLDVAAEELEISPEDLEIVDGAVQPGRRPGEGDGDRAARQQGADVRQPVSAGRGATAACRCRRRPRPPRICRTCGWIRDTGAVTVLGHVIAQDVGRALNPALVKGQMQGGVTQGLGWALLEELAYDENGQPVDGIVRRVRDADRRRGSAHRHRGRRGARARGAIRGQGRRRGAGGRRRRRGRQRDRGRRRRRAAAPAADDPRAGVAGDPGDG